MSDIYEHVHKGLNEPLMTLFEALKNKEQTSIVAQGGTTNCMAWGKFATREKVRYFIMQNAM